MKTRALFSIVALLVLVCLAWGAEKSWTGVVSDSNCGLKHATASADAAACVAKCVEGGGTYVLVSKGKLYQLDPQDKIAKSLAGKEVKITGTLSGDKITVASATEVAAKK